MARKAIQSLDGRSLKISMEMTQTRITTKNVIIKKRWRRRSTMTRKLGVDITEMGYMLQHPLLALGVLLQHIQ